MNKKLSKQEVHDKISRKMNQLEQQRIYVAYGFIGYWMLWFMAFPTLALLVS
jgi:hypothetical protein